MVVFALPFVQLTTALLYFTFCNAQCPNSSQLVSVNTQNMCRENLIPISVVPNPTNFYCYSASGWRDAQVCGPSDCTDGCASALQAIDNDPNTKWNPHFGSYPYSLELEYASPVAPTQLYLLLTGDGGVYDRNQYTVKSTNTQGSGYTTVTSITRSGNPGQVTQYYDLPAGVQPAKYWWVGFNNEVDQILLFEAGFSITLPGT